jgi:phosphoglycerol transferase MdoB-like AlkP superfamily enzyme
MAFTKNWPKAIRFTLSVMLMLLICMTLYRFYFFYHFRPASRPLSGKMLLLGLRYDLRIAAVTGFIMLILISLPFLSAFKNKKNFRTWIYILGLIFFIFLIFYGGDFYYYDYLKQRLSAAVLNFAKDAGISSRMMWQTYPVIKIVLLLITAVALFIVWIKKTFIKIYDEQSTVSKRTKRFSYITIIILFALAIFGKIGQYPLRWSDAFTLNDDFKANAALNPFQSFFSTMSFKNSGYDIRNVRATYPVIADYFGIKNRDENTIFLNRTNLINADTVSNKPNIVVVICESFSAYKSSMFGNKLNATPYFNELCNNGVFFERCFTPAFGTARGVWATLTGIPDVESPNTASRNPAAVDQHTIMNDFTGYEKFYFLGGSTTWANIRGLLTNNISGLKIYEEADFKQKKVDVWGISDKNLFYEANKVFAVQTKPFLSIIQTADNHRPYTIPEEDRAVFKILNYPQDTLKKYGFDDNGQFNAFRYTDFCFESFIESAKKEKYFSNTVFIFAGDHGLRGDAGNMFPQSFTRQGILAEHVPLLFYAPNLLSAKRISQPASQLDIFPSAAFLAKINFTNTTLGNNLFDTTIKNRVAFIADPDTRTTGVVSEEYYYGKNLKTGKADFVSVINNDPVPTNTRTDSIQTRLKTLTDGFYNTSQYLLLNNKKQSANK